MSRNSPSRNSPNRNSPNRNSLISLALSLFLCGHALAQHKEYHVAVNGNDSADGSVNHPFRTITAAANLAMPGDIITVHAGTYREQITPPRGGNSDKERIVYRAAKGEHVVIKGSEIVTGWEKAGADTWLVHLPNAFFKKFNPYSDRIRGDWFYPTPKNRIYHTGAVYLHGDWLMEAAAKEEVMRPEDAKDPLWWATVDSTTTTIWAQFKNADPNKDTVEINVRQTVFYPDKPFINFITVQGFVMEDAATNWAPPTAEQMGLIGTHWSRGWIIEDNTIQYSKCSGIALGKYGDTWDNNNTESAEGYVGTIKRALAFGWNKGTIGGHLVQNNRIAYCEQSGIVGSMGCSFSVIRGNVIHDIHIRRLFSGAEMAGIKFHGAIDVVIDHNRIYRSDMGVWLDWMAQGAQVTGNLFYENTQWDVFFEVDHGPLLCANNVCLSRVSALMNSSGVAFVHNLLSSPVRVIPYDSRLTPYMKPHSTFVTALHDNPGGDVRFINNLFVGKATARAYDRSLQGAVFSGNVFTKGTNEAQPDELAQNLPVSKRPSLKDKTETAEWDARDYDADTRLIKDGNDDVYLEISLDKSWVAGRKRTLVTSAVLGNALVPDLPFENPDGSPVRIDTDYKGRKRNAVHPSPGPFEITRDGRQRIRVW
ncbi:MAG TPA: right-handed parallel beta-helix repeat-containing protein [Puia sp.]|nr:right-handed parallel beta-helix repeat-containing protein [Puia sp.]